MPVLYLKFSYPQPFKALAVAERETESRLGALPPNPRDMKGSRRDFPRRAAQRSAHQRVSAIIIDVPGEGFSTDGSRN